MRIGNDYIMDSRKIADRLEKDYPNPPLFLDSPLTQQVSNMYGKFAEPMRPAWMPLVAQNLLNPSSKEYFEYESPLMLIFP
jgi:hypothetical protein